MEDWTLEPEFLNVLDEGQPKAVTVRVKPGKYITKAIIRNETPYKFVSIRKGTKFEFMEAPF